MAKAPTITVVVELSEQPNDLGILHDALMPKGRIIESVKVEKGQDRIWRTITTYHDGQFDIRRATVQEVWMMIDKVKRNEYEA